MLKTFYIVIFMFFILYLLYKVIQIQLKSDWLRIGLMYISVDRVDVHLTVYKVFVEEQLTIKQTLL